MSEEEVKKLVEKFLPKVNEVLAIVRRVISGQDLALSAKVPILKTLLQRQNLLFQVLGVLYMVARVSAIFSLFTLAYLGM